MYSRSHFVLNNFCLCKTTEFFLNEFNISLSKSYTVCSTHTHLERQIPRAGIPKRPKRTYLHPAIRNFLRMKVVYPWPFGHFGTLLRHLFSVVFKNCLLEIPVIRNVSDDSKEINVHTHKNIEPTLEALTNKAGISFCLRAQRLFICS